MPRQVALRVFLVFAVLLAQQAALAHQYWHASKAAVAADGTTPAKGDGLCDLHDLLGTVLGVATGPALGHEPLSFGDIGFASIALHWAENRPLAAQSRGPPLIS